jgi:hypothetical protein
LKSVVLAVILVAVAFWPARGAACQAQLKALRPV